MCNLHNHSVMLINGLIIELWWLPAVLWGDSQQTCYKLQHSDYKDMKEIKKPFDDSLTMF